MTRFKIDLIKLQAELARSRGDYQKVDDLQVELHRTERRALYHLGLTRPQGTHHTGTRGGSTRGGTCPPGSPPLPQRGGEGLGVGRGDNPLERITITVTPANRDDFGK